ATISSVFIIHQKPGAWGWASISIILLALIIGMRQGKAVVVQKKIMADGAKKQSSIQFLD
ncbi:MAG: hypothetical protein WCD24_23450, partial [Serratia inhibens]|uniref:hypothetical protein n=1 Tax=Serratia inhibens TaxID=2338073 RepID=UPI003C7D96A2